MVSRRANVFWFTLVSKLRAMRVPVTIVWRIRRRMIILL